MRHALTRTVIIAALSLPVVLASATALAAVPAKWGPAMELEGRVNSDRSLISPKIMIPLSQDNDSLLFTDIRMRLDDNRSEEYNIGLGLRAMRGDWIIGGYGFVDYLSSANNFEYWQATAGVEAMSESWTLRANAYLPESGQNSLGGGGALVVDGGGNFGITAGGRERALPGFDAEVGYQLPVDAFDVSVYGGVYHFDASGYEDVSGPKARVEFTVGHQHFNAIPDGMEFTAGVQYQNDGPREGTTTALAQIKIPFGDAPRASTLSKLDRRMTTFIERDVDIVTSAAGGGVAEAAEVTVNGQTYTGVDATINASTADINAALTTAGNNALVVFDGAMDVTADVTPLQGQTLLGGGTSITATGQTSGNNFTTTIPGTRPTLTGQGGGLSQVVIISSDDIHMQGFDIDVNSINGVNGLFANAVNDVDVQDINVTNVTTGYGVYSQFTDNLTLRDVTTDSGSIGIYILSGDTNTTIVDSNVSNATSFGIQLFASDNTSITNTTITDSATGLRLNSATNGSGDITTSGNGADCSLNGINTGSSFTINGGPGTCP